MWHQRLTLTWLNALLWIAVILTLSIFTAGFYNYDSFKYVGIAETMLQKQQYFLPYYQGQPYPDKGPLLFWLFIVGWKLIGQVNQVWPQLLMFISATGSLWLTMAMARLLWPTERLIKTLLPVILMGMPCWLATTTQIRTDVILLFCCLLSLFSLLKVARGSPRYWCLYAFAMLLGGLSKGPLILLFCFIPGLCLPLFNDFAVKKSSWYGYLLFSTLLGFSAILFWMIPAMQLGGMHYSQQILVGQLSGRVHQHFDSVFYYLLRLPLLLFPWLFYIPFYYGVTKLFKQGLDASDKFLVLISMFLLVVFSFYGQKRLHYILPLFPLFALLITRAIVLYHQQFPAIRRFDQMYMGSLYLALAVAFWILPWLDLHLDPRATIHVTWFIEHRLWWLIGLIPLGLSYYFYTPKTLEGQLFFMGMPLLLLTMVVNLMNVLVV